MMVKEEFDRGGQITLSMETGVHDVATLLKEFFRDLPEPLLPKEVQSALLAIHSKLAISNWLQCCQIRADASNLTVIHCYNYMPQ